ncbi:tripartite tricarboxylate transporter permease [Saccharopolyspora sp. WRP15-2]|uniref:Tripartite tricarboxylate transporter permease n=1 Tax=Saccharopolyspora oryzae TaxID=2997343 RepID=A0ABT4V726_9PSEU|nr:tripartite tricarboxylate transporter permease [Saccharopolyspora oryzae]MDA3629755.1 tripartite tricarboxylate transporter permease [Saccharopolyspora oryzae]
MILNEILIALSMGLIGAVVFSAIGMVSGTDETATLAPLTLLVVMLGVPPVGVFTFFIAAAVSKHMTHAIPTTLLGIPGDTTAVPLLPEANMLRRLGIPHIALRKAISGAILSAFIAVPVAVGLAAVLAPLGTHITAAAPYVFVVAAVLIGYFSPGRWTSIACIVPFVLLVTAVNALSKDVIGETLSISFFLGIAVGPLIADLLQLASRTGRSAMPATGRKVFWLGPEVKDWSGYLPNPAKVLSPKQIAMTSAAAGVSSTTFVFSPVATTVLAGELVGSRIKHVYERLTSVLAVKNGTTESTYLAETLIPLVAFGLPLSPVAAGPAAPLFNAPPVYGVDEATGQVHNLHTMMSTWQFLVFGLVGVGLAAIVAYPLSMNFARSASLWVMRKVSHEALIGAFAGLIVVISWYEGGAFGVAATLLIATFAGVANRLFGMNAGVQFMAYYVAVLFVPKVIGLA